MCPLDTLVCLLRHCDPRDMRQGPKELKFLDFGPLPAGIKYKPWLYEADLEPETDYCFQDAQKTLPTSNVPKSYSYKAKISL